MVRVSSLFLIVVLCSVSIRAAAQTRGSGRPDESVQYRAAVDTAIDEFDQGNFSEALEHFSRAHAVFPSARTLRGMGMSEFELHNYVTAVDELEQALASSTKRLEGELREQTLALLARASAYVGEVRLQVEPASSSVRVDGFPPRFAANGNLRLSVGEHVLEFRADGRLNERRALKVRGEQVTVIEVTLASVARAFEEDTRSTPSPVASTIPAVPIYKRWWLWTGVGAVVLGGIATAVALSLRTTRVEDPAGGSTGDRLFVR